MSGLRRVIRAHSGSNSQRMCPNMLVARPLQVHAKPGSQKDDKNVHMSRRKSPRAGTNASSIPPHPIPDLLAPTWPASTPRTSLGRRLNIRCIRAQQPTTLAVALTATAASYLRFRARFRILRTSPRQDEEFEPEFSLWLHL